MDEPYAGICGITEDELVNGMRDDIEAHQVQRRRSEDETTNENEWGARGRELQQTTERNEMVWV